MALAKLSITSLLIGAWLINKYKAIRILCILVSLLGSMKILKSL